jgi:hypothetical protein
MFLIGFGIAGLLSLPWIGYQVWLRRAQDRIMAKIDAAEASGSITTTEAYQLRLEVLRP